MEEDYKCKFCNHGFSNGDLLEVHMKKHLGALVSCCKKQSIVENNQDSVNGGMGVDFVNEKIKKNEEILKFYEDCVDNSYGLKENSKKTPVLNLKSVSDASCKQLHMKSHSVKKMCVECGKSFDTFKALYWHMRCHTIKKCQPCEKSTSSSSSSFLEHCKLDKELKRDTSNSVSKKRSETMYKPAKPNDASSSTSMSVLPSNDEDYDNEAVVGALGLMMLSRGFTDLDLVRAKRLSFTDHELVLSADGSILFTKKEGFGESGSVQDNTDILKNNAKSTGEYGRGKGKGKACVDQFNNEMRKSKGHICSVCFKEFRSGQALGGHKRAHNNVNKSNETAVNEETGDSFNIRGHLDG
uniref:zinc finger protein ZAT1-like n=1 Tax=Erigeron canadensis TaxID=72917 RepID=UPI001CB9C81E|nr:zinc finger protein ZAT1-like [Erigeron canadensis]